MGLDHTRFHESNERLKSVHKPLFFRLANVEDSKRFRELLDKEVVFFHDELYDQLKELIKSRHPKQVLSADDIKRRVTEHLAGMDSDEYGVWVYYPWSGRMVHILDEAEYIELRTAANKNKITIEERDLLATKKVGVIGLSVGQSVSVTLALERGCGELRVADFDTLELNNLNRIRTGVHNLGLMKAYSVAREIAEIDPFFKVVCYTEGITDENIDDFFLEGGKLDAVIDECDGINIKILCRIKAKELRVPVLMEASDRATLDVERFDLEPDRPIMHGWLEHLDLDLEVLKNLKTNEEKIPYILPISGLETLSVRMRASMIEMRNTLTTWPQLATAVMLGGALTADTCRRMFLDQYTDSGRYFIDLEQLVPDKRPKLKFAPPATPPPLTVDAMKQVITNVAPSLSLCDYEPGEEIIRDLVAAAIKAPSAANSQPWKWHWRGGYLYLFHEYTGVTSFSDLEGIASTLAHGAALENLGLQASRSGLVARIHLYPSPTNKALVAAVSFKKDDDKPSELYRPEELARQINARHTSVVRTPKKELSPAVTTELTNAVSSVPGATLTLITDPGLMTALGDILGSADRLKMLDPAGHYEFYEQQARWSNEDADKAKNGIAIDRMGISPGEVILLKMAKEPQVTDLLGKWKGGQALEISSRISLSMAGAVGVITMPDDTRRDMIAGGMAMERMWLAATELGIGVQPMMSLVSLFTRWRHESDDQVPPFIKTETGELARRFDELLPALTGLRPVFICRLNPSGEATVVTPRLPLDDVLSFG